MRISFFTLFAGKMVIWTFYTIKSDSFSLKISISFINMFTRNAIFLFSIHGFTTKNFIKLFWMIVTSNNSKKIFIDLISQCNFFEFFQFFYKISSIPVILAYEAEIKIILDIVMQNINRNNGLNYCANTIEMNMLKSLMEIASKKLCEQLYVFVICR